MQRTRAFLGVVITGLVCAADDASHPSAEVEASLEALATEGLGLGVAIEDDRNSLWRALADAEKKAGKAEEARHVAAQWLAEIRRRPPAASDEVLESRDLALLHAAEALGDTLQVVSALEAGEHALPSSYTASECLASAYLGAKRPADAVAASSRGLAKHPGPMGTVRLLRLRAHAEAAMGAVAKARQDLEAARQAASHANRGSKGLIEAIDAQLRDLRE
jgi:hypothetical protein